MLPFYPHTSRRGLRQCVSCLFGTFRIGSRQFGRFRITPDGLAAFRNRLNLLGMVWQSEVANPLKSLATRWLLVPPCAGSNPAAPATFASAMATPGTTPALHYGRTETRSLPASPVAATAWPVPSEMLADNERSCGGGDICTEVAAAARTALAPRCGVGEETGRGMPVAGAAAGRYGVEALHTVTPIITLNRSPHADPGRASSRSVQLGHVAS